MVPDMAPYTKGWIRYQNSGRIFDHTYLGQRNLASRFCSGLFLQSGVRLVHGTAIFGSTSPLKTPGLFLNERLGHSQELQLQPVFGRSRRR